MISTPFSLLANQRDSSEMGSEAADEIMVENVDSFSGRSRGPRLFIKEMVLRNFKSYAGEQRVGPFHKVGYHLKPRVFFFFFVMRISNLSCLVNLFPLNFKFPSPLPALFI